MPNCVVPGCGRGATFKKVRVHSFPKEDTLLYKIWKERVANPRLEEHFKGKIFVCNRHFIKECQSPGTKRLKKHSLPTIDCPGFNGPPTITNSFLFPPKVLNSSTKPIEKSEMKNKKNEQLIDNNSRNNALMQPHCSKSTYPFFVDLTDSQADDEEDDVIEIEQGLNYSNQYAHGPSTSKNDEACPNFVDLTDLTEENDTREIEFQKHRKFTDRGLYGSSNICNKYVDPLANCGNTDLYEELNQRSLIHEGAKLENEENATNEKQRVKRNERLAKQLRDKKKLINFVRTRCVPRRLNVYKPVGFSNRQKWAWRILHYLKLVIKKGKVVVKKKEKNEDNLSDIITIDDEIFNDDNIRQLINKSSLTITKTPKPIIKKPEPISKTSQPINKTPEPISKTPEPNTNILGKQQNILGSISKPVLYKDLLRITEEFVKSKNFNLLAMRCGINPLAVKLLSLQMKTKLLCPLRQKFSKEDKIFLFSIYKKFGFKKYKELGDCCALPPPKFLFDLMEKVPFQPGLNQQVFNNLRKSVVKLDEADKYCSVIFQEVLLTKEYIVESGETTEEEDDDAAKDDKRQGCVNKDEEKRRKVKPKGNNIVIVMLRGINRDWRQPVVFDVTVGRIKPYDLASLLRQVISCTLGIGLRVVAAVFNKKERYVEALSFLNSEFFPLADDENSSSEIKKSRKINLRGAGIDIYQVRRRSESIHLGGDKQRNPIWTTGYALHLDNNEITLLYNPSNLLKTVRNNWLTYDISFAENGKVKQASWNHVMKLYAADYGNEETKLCPKLSNRHVVIDEVDKGSTRCCTQVFSQRVSSVMRCFGRLGVCGMNSAALDTADLLLFFDKLFDSVNGTSAIPPRGKQLRCSLSVGSPHRDFWRLATTILASMRFLTPFKEESNVFNLWLATLASLHRLCDRLINQKGLTSLPLGHLNCDPLETFVRNGLRQDAHSLKPTYDTFLDSFKTLLFTGDLLYSDMTSYQIHQLDLLRDYIYDEIPSTLSKT